MTKEQIMNDIAFRNCCTKLGLDWQTAEIKDQMIVVSNAEKMYVLLDENYKIIDCIYLPTNRELESCYKDYVTPPSKRMNHQLGYPLNSFSLKEIQSITANVKYTTDENGFPKKVFVKDKEYEYTEDNLYVKFLLFLKFFEIEIESYWNRVYQFKLLGYKMPDVRSYLSEIRKNIQVCIFENIFSEQNIQPNDILKYIYQPDFSEIAVLYPTIDILIMSNGYSIQKNKFGIQYSNFATDYINEFNTFLADFQKDPYQEKTVQKMLKY